MNPPTNLESPSKEEFDAQAAEERISAKKTLEEVLLHTDTIEDVLIMIRDKEGYVGFVTNLEGIAESIMFMEVVKYKSLEKTMGGV